MRITATNAKEEFQKTQTLKQYIITGIGTKNMQDIFKETRETAGQKQGDPQDYGTKGILVRNDSIQNYTI